MIDGAKILADWLGSGGHIVSQDVALHRAHVCLRCPMNVPGNPLVGAAAAAIKQMLKLKNRMALRVAGEKSLHTCSACSCNLRLKVWMPPDRIKKITDAATFTLLHESCWIRKEAA